MRRDSNFSPQQALSFNRSKLTTIFGEKYSAGYGTWLSQPLSILTPSKSLQCKQEDDESPDLRSSADAQSGLKEADVAEASARLEEAYKEASSKSAEQASAAFPGSVNQQLQVWCWNWIQKSACKVSMRSQRQLCNGRNLTYVLFWYVQSWMQKDILCGTWGYDSERKTVLNLQMWRRLAQCMKLSLECYTFLRAAKCKLSHLNEKDQVMKIVSPGPAAVRLSMNHKNSQLSIKNELESLAQAKAWYCSNLWHNSWAVLRDPTESG